MFDFGNLLYSKNQLENTSTDIVRLILNDELLNTISHEYSDYNITVSNYNEKSKKVTIQQEIKVITPFLDRVLGNPCVIKVERIIPVVEKNGDDDATE